MWCATRVGGETGKEVVSYASRLERATGLEVLQFEKDSFRSLRQRAGFLERSLDPGFLLLLRRG